MVKEIIKEIRRKGFKFFTNNGRFPTELKTSREELDEITNTKGIGPYLRITGEEMYIDDLLVVIDNSIEGFEVE